MFAKNLESKEQKPQITFGCEITAAYKECFIIDSANCFKVWPDGRLSLKSSIIGFGKVYSRRRLHPKYAQDLAKEINGWLLVNSKKENFIKTAKSMSKFICKQIVNNLPPLTNSQEPMLPQKNPTAYSILSKKNKSDLISNINQTLNYVLNELFEEDDAKKIHASLIAASKDELQLLNRILNNPSAIKRRFSNQLLAVIELSFSKNRNRLQEFIHSLQSKIKPELLYTGAEQTVVDILEKKLLPTEILRLEARKTTLVVSPNLNGLDVGSDTRAQFLKSRNTVFVKLDNVNCSLIHEVQHSLGRDISPIHPIRLFKFYKSCKVLRLSNKSFHFALADELIVLAFENKAKKEPDNKFLHYQIRRAKYLLSLHNYAPHERNGEILAHLRQFIADFGPIDTAKFLPRLYHYWINDVLGKYSMPSEPKLALK